MLIGLCLWSLAVVAGAPLPQPDVANGSYGPHPRNTFDLWLAKSSKPTPLVIFIHGGGFLRGSKEDLNPVLLAICRQADISVAAINYRLAEHAPYPAPMMDGARAVQFFRSKAREWNLNSAAIAATGQSAGAGIALWIAFHNDLRDPASPDPVKRQSSRLTTVAAGGAQTSYDPIVVAQIAGEAAARHPLFEGLYGIPRKEFDTDRARKMFSDASPVTHLTRDDPSVLVVYWEPDEPVPASARDGQGIHHPAFGRFLKERMQQLGLECTLATSSTRPDGDEVPRIIGDYLKRKLGSN